eukprot:m.94750 g.94750  ORF g.94750 m.94750 type:complete len:678 (+) comp13458_c0_seq1:113-2146(+)
MMEPVKQKPGAPGETPEERIAARRKRIAARIQEQNGNAPATAQKKDNDSLPVPEEAAKSLAQVSKTHQMLDMSLEQGVEKVSLIRIEADMAESKRRQELDDARDERRARLQKDLATSREEYEEISSKWENALAQVGVDDLQEALAAQQSACDALLEQKQKLMDVFRNTLKEKDDEFVNELRSQAADIAKIIDTMNEETRRVGGEYKSQTTVVEEVMVEDRRDLVTAAFDKWKADMKERLQTEEALHDGRLNKAQEYEEQLDHLRLMNDEKLAAVKLKLETDIANLQQELQKMRATYQLNSEKLEYNLQVLRKRDDENQTTKVQQKRKMLRMQDSLNALKAKLKKQEKAFLEENGALTEDYKRISEQFKDLQKKFNHFQNLEKDRYSEVWKMNEEEAVELAQKVLEGDRIIFEQQLGLNWHGPSPSVLQSDVSAAMDLERKASDALVDIMEVHGDDDRKGSDSASDLPSGAVRDALELLCDEAGFLVEAKLDTLLEPLAKEERSMIRLDSIFKALGVESEADILRLASYFVRFDETHSQEGHTLISPEEVNEALRAFVDDTREGKNIANTTRMLKTQTKVEAKDSNNDFWQKLVEAHPEEHVDTWDTLSDSLNDYAEILKGRVTAVQDCEHLRAQNEELRMLLHRYMSADVNRELVIPPGDVMAHQMRQQQAMRQAAS